MTRFFILQAWKLPMTVKDHDSVEAILAAATNAEAGTKVARRLQAVAMAKQGLSGPHIGRLPGEQVGTIKRWVRRYNAEETYRSADKPHYGRPTKLPRDQEQRFGQRLEAGSTEVDGVSVLHGGDYQRILEEVFGSLTASPGFSSCSTG